jgi:hypothetical protein
MALELFGFRLDRNKPDPETSNESFAPKVQDDGASIVQAGGAYGTYLDLDGSVRNEAELITRYREMSLQPEIDSAIDDIVNEMVVYDAQEDLVTLNLEEVDFYSDKIKKRIVDEFEEVLRLFDFNANAYELCRRWYIDGRMNYHVIIDEENPDDGIQELRYIDPRKLRKIREVTRNGDKHSMYTTLQTKTEYYIYNDRGFSLKETNTQGAPYTQATGIKISADSIIRATSGLMDPTNQMVLGYLNKAIKALNQLRTLEDASVIYRLTRAPERRIFYIDVGSLPKAKAEQYLRDMMAKHKNKVVYDASTGEIRDDRKFMTMLEDFWLPRREGGRGTEISTLPGSGSFSDMSDIEYFLNKLYKSLNVPTSRLQTDQSFNMGRSSEITRDEVKFSKFVNRLRMRFSILFRQALEQQLVLKKIITKEEAPYLWAKAKFDFKRDNMYEELKEIEIMQARLAVLGDIVQYQGTFYSADWIKKNVCRQDEDEVKEMQKQMDEEGAQAMAMPDNGEDDDADGAGPGQAVIGARRDKTGGAPQFGGNQGDQQQGSSKPNPFGTSKKSFPQTK